MSNFEVPDRICLEFFLLPNSLIWGVGWRIIQKISKKIDFCHFSRGVLSLGWGGMGVLQCKRLNYPLQMGQIWLIMTQDDWLWSRMTYQGSWGHQGIQGAPGARHQGVPGGSRIPPAPKRVIKQQNNDHKPWFEVPKVCPDPKGMVFTHFWGIWGHLDGLQQRYKVKTSICQKTGFT